MEDVNSSAETLIHVKRETSKKLKLYKILKTLYLITIWFCIGLWSSIPSPCIDALKDIIHGNYADVAKVMASKSVGMMLGSIICGFLADKFKRWVDVILGCCLLLCGAAFASIPFMSNLILMAVSFTICGMCQGSISAVGNSHALAMWGMEASAPLHAIHSGFGVGTVIGPLIVAPFLPSSHNNTNNSSNFDMIPNTNAFYYKLVLFDENIDLKQNHTSMNWHPSSISTAYIIAGGFSAFISIISFIYGFFPLTFYQSMEARNKDWKRQTESCDTSHHSATVVDENKTFREIVSPASCAQGNLGYGLQMFIMIFFFVIFLTGKECLASGYLQPIAVHTDTLQFTYREADIVLAAYNSCYTLGRILISIVGHWISIKILVFIESIGNILLLTVILLYGLESKLNFWLTICFFALVSGPYFPSGLSWCDRYIKMTAIALAVLDVALGVGGFVFNWLAGFLLKTHPIKPELLFFAAIACSISSTILLFIMQIRGSIFGDRYEHSSEAPDSPQESQEDADHLISTYDDVQDQDNLIHIQ